MVNRSCVQTLGGSTHVPWLPGVPTPCRAPQLHTLLSFDLDCQIRYLGGGACGFRHEIREGGRHFRPVSAASTPKSVARGPLVKVPQSPNETAITFARMRRPPMRRIELRFGNSDRSVIVTKIAITVLAAITFAGSTVCVASGEPIDSGSKPSSFAPQPHSNDHIYGAPIEPPILGHSKSTYHTHVQKKRSTRAKTHDAPKARVRHHNRAPKQRG